MDFNFKNNKFGMLSMIIGIASLLLSCVFYGFAGVPSIIFGVKAIKRTDTKNIPAIIGISTSALAILISTIAGIVFLESYNSESTSLSDTEISSEVSTEIARGTTESRITRTTEDADKDIEDGTLTTTESVSQTSTTEIIEHETQSPTEVITESSTEPVSEAPAEIVTEAPTESITEAPSETAAPTETPTEVVQESAPVAPGTTYVLNNNSYKFHKPSCSSVPKIAGYNRQDVTWSREEVINAGYDPCGNCNP